jgi:hypothetical protein
LAPGTTVSLSLSLSPFLSLSACIPTPILYNRK